jgi:hypothetical protein
LIALDALFLRKADSEPSPLESLIDEESSVGTSSFHTFSTIPLPMKTQSEHVALSRMRYLSSTCIEAIRVIWTVQRDEYGKGWGCELWV